MLVDKTIEKTAEAIGDPSIGDAAKEVKNIVKDAPEIILDPKGHVKDRLVDDFKGAVHGEIKNQTKKTLGIPQKN